MGFETSLDLSLGHCVKQFHNFQIRMMRQNGQSNGQQNGGRHHSNAELVSNATSAAHNEIPLASNSTHLTVPSFNSSAAITSPNNFTNFHQNSGIQIKDSEIV